MSRLVMAKSKSDETHQVRSNNNSSCNGLDESALSNKGERNKGMEIHSCLYRARSRNLFSIESQKSPYTK